ncbi:MAG: M3 family metallopeptidase, partial [Candidatus Dependentiae bacterium]|nr:M3 family metallopeptidase [Candidatus Dependentiae bacterium]
MANFPKSTASKPALLKRQDVSTFFHEFGHALHALCGATQMASFSGTSVKRDFVEMPSQMLEEWLWDKEILQKIGNHYETGESMPDALIDSIIALKTYDSGFWVKRQAFFSLIALHYYAAGEHKDASQLWNSLYAEFNPRAIGCKYIQEVIGKGGSQDPNELLATFLGREPHSGAFFKSMGLE